jgi:pimeloyl-ACP methyl ester carboxylesterase
MAKITRRSLAAASLAFAAASAVPAWAAAGPPIRLADIGGGIRLHYVEIGDGSPVVFIHGSLSDGGYWNEQLPAFAQAGHRAIAYSRRYNAPNLNPARAGYSAVVDAEDLVGLIEALGLGRVHLVGHSYGALTALILAARRPELVRTVVLAEAPAMSLLDHAPEPDTAKGKAMLADVRAHMVAPMRQAFLRGDREGGVRIFIDYVFGRPGAWDAMSAADRTATMKDVHEWDVMMTTGELFPTVTLREVRGIHAPTLLLSGAKSYPFLGLIDETLMSLLPNAKRVVFPDAGHQMWLQQPAACRNAALALQQKA